MSKSTQVELQIRVDKVAEFLMQGRTRSFLINYARDNWNVGRTAVDDYIAHAKKEIQEINEGNIEESQAIILRGLWTQYRNASESQRISDAISCLKEIAKLKGLDQSTINLKVDRPLKELSDEELDKLLAENNDN